MKKKSGGTNKKVCRKKKKKSTTGDKAIITEQGMKRGGDYKRPVKKSREKLNNVVVRDRGANGGAARGLCWKGSPE